MIHAVQICKSVGRNLRGAGQERERQRLRVATDAEKAHWADLLLELDRRAGERGRGGAQRDERFAVAADLKCAREHLVAVDEMTGSDRARSTTVNVAGEEATIVAATLVVYSLRHSRHEGPEASGSTAS